MLSAAKRRHRRLPMGATEDAGFTLVEVIAALAILSLSLSLLFSTLSDGFHRQRRARAMNEASVLAQSQLAKVGAEWPLALGETRGDFSNGWRWEIRMSAFGSGADAREWPVAAYEVVVRVFAQPPATEPLARLTTLRLGPKEPSR